MGKYYLGILKKDLEVLFSDGTVKLNKSCIHKIEEDFKKAVSNATNLAYINNTSEFVVLELTSNSLENNLFKKIHLGDEFSFDSPYYEILGYYTSVIPIEEVNCFESAIKLFLNFNDILTDDFFESLICADEDDIYNHINLKEINKVPILSVIDKEKLNNFIIIKEEEFSEASNFIYSKL